MRAPIFQIDAFATRLFTGNPAAVVPGSVLGPAIEPNGVSGFPGVATRWGSPLPRGRRPRSPGSGCVFYLEGTVEL
jgi:hypothetical protein